MSRQVGWFLGAFGVVLTAASSASAQAPVAPATPALAPKAAAAPSKAPAAVAPATECFPSCRSGYTCHNGQCISLCNPPCASGEHCLASGECEKDTATPPATPVPDASVADAKAPVAPAEPAVAPAPAPEPAPAPVVAAPPPPPAVTTQAAPTPALVAEERARVLQPAGSFVFAAHVGIKLIGKGRTELSCTDTIGGLCSRKPELDYTDQSWVTLGVDGMFHVTPGMRLGLGYALVPYAAIGSEPNEADSQHLGHEHGLNALVEGLVPLKPQLALALRAHGGVRMLVTGGDLASSTDKLLEDCKDTAGDHCEAARGPFFGGTLGGTAGVILGDKVRARFDLGVDRVFYKLRDTSHEYQPGTALSEKRTDRQTLAGTRLWLLLGIEI